MGPAAVGQVDLMVPVKPLHLAKSRLRGPRAGNDPEHHRLVLAVTRDTIRAALAASRVRRLLAICSDPAAAAVLHGDGVEVVADLPAAGLNPALRHGGALLQARDPAAVVGALQADLPALVAGELDAALDAALAAFQDGASAAFCPDRAGTGTTLLLTRAGTAIDPRFGAQSAAAHTAAGAHRLDGPWPTVRCDVDTDRDLAAAARLGLGPYTTAVLAGRAATRSGQR